MTTKPPLQKILKEFCTRKMKANKTTRGQTDQTTGEEKTKNQRVAMIQLHTIKPSDNKND
jgi:hypothetical protein